MNRIHVKGSFRHEEASAGGAGIYPGMLLQLTSAGAVVVHATEGGRAERAFAVEDALQGKTTADVYTSGQIVSYGLFEPGAEIYAKLEAGANVTKGDHLISAGNGKLIGLDEAGSGVSVLQAIAVAMETADLSQSGDVDTLIKVRIL